MNCPGNVRHLPYRAKMIARKVVTHSGDLFTLSEEPLRNICPRIVPLFRQRPPIPQELVGDVSNTIGQLNDLHPASQSVVSELALRLSVVL